MSESLREFELGPEIEHGLDLDFAGHGLAGRRGNEEARRSEIAYAKSLVQDPLGAYFLYDHVFHENWHTSEGFFGGSERGEPFGPFFDLSTGRYAVERLKDIVWLLKVSSHPYADPDEMRRFDEDLAKYEENLSSHGG